MSENTGLIGAGIAVGIAVLYKKVLIPIMDRSSERLGMTITEVVTDAKASNNEVADVIVARAARDNLPTAA